jgi:cytochrome b561
MFRNSTTAWGFPAKALHWVGALAILILLIHGWWMTHVTLRPDRLANYGWHAALGYDLLMLTVLRLLWRWMNPVPELPPDSKPWERWSAHGVHAGLYVLMFVVSVTGWIVATTFRTPMTADLFGVQIPPLVTGLERGVRDLFEESHEILAYCLGVLVLAHIIGALRHHFIKRNDILRRMA